MSVNTLTHPSTRHILHSFFNFTNINFTGIKLLLLFANRKHKSWEHDLRNEGAVIIATLISIKGGRQSQFRDGSPFNVIR